MAKTFDDQKWADTMKAAVKRLLMDSPKTYLNDDWEEYVREAEHQDGIGYWREFANPSDIVRDFELYLRMRDADSDPLTSHAFIDLVATGSITPDTLDKMWSLLCKKPIEFLRELQTEPTKYDYKTIAFDIVAGCRDEAHLRKLYHEATKS